MKGFNVFALCCFSSEVYANLVPNFRNLRSVHELNTRKKIDLKPWDQRVDPNPLPSIDELANTITDVEIDDILDQITGKNSGVIIRRFMPEAYWLWKQWKGTVLYHSLGKAAFNMCAAFVVCVFLKKTSGGEWSIGVSPNSADPANPVVARLKVLEKVWSLMMGLTTFFITFFVGQAYNLWREFYIICRSIQGRLNDLFILLATHGGRNRNDASTYSPQALALLQDVGRQLRAYHILMWAGCTRRFRALLTNRGLTRMVVRGLITQREKDTLDKLNLPQTQKYNAFLVWSVIRCNEALRKKILVGDPTALTQIILEKACALRGVVGSIGDQLDGRMPLAYAHFVQILVDSFLILAPFAQYAQLGAFSVLSIGILTIFYSGLLDLAKVFLDPVDNEDYCQGSVHIDIAVLILEVNAGSTRFKDGGAFLC